MYITQANRFSKGAERDRLHAQTHAEGTLPYCNPRVGDAEVGAGEEDLELDLEVLLHGVEEVEDDTQSQRQHRKVLGARVLDKEFAQFRLDPCVGGCCERS